VVILFTYQQLNKPLEKPQYNYKQHSHRILYVDNGFSDEKKEIITHAALNWNTRTKGIIQFDVVMLPTQEPLDVVNGIVIEEVSEYDPDILSLDEKNQAITLGYYSGHGHIPSISLVAARIDKDDYHSVILHELGHSLGLNHKIGHDGIGTLMYPSIEMSAENITDTDIEDLCKIYECDPNKLNN
jgi:hypothetical protein